MKILKYSLFLFSLFLFVQTVPAQSSMDKNKDIAPFIKSVLNDLNEVEGKVVSLAEAMPQNTYDWRPMEGVRSVSEVYKHIAASNYFILSFVGGKKKEGMGENMGKDVKDKEQIIKTLKDSYAYTKDFISKMSASDLDKGVDFFGNKTDYRGMLFILLGDNHEHLGQSIAYARTNHVVPPWSRKK